MTKSEAKTRIAKLREEIRYHREQYHVYDKETISEAALDALKHELYTLEQEYPDLITSDSPTQRVGGEPLEGFKKIEHREPMLSMEDVFTFEELKKWYKRLQDRSDVEDLELFCMLKLDGLALSLEYKEGVLETAATRGNGRVGEDVTHNARTIDAIPLRIDTVRLASNKSSFTVRGEVYFPVKAFTKMNKKNEKAGGQIFANPRNAAAGSIRQLDPSIAASRPLDYLAWDIVTNHGQTTHKEDWELTKSLGFKVNKEFLVTNSLDEVHTFWKEIQKKRDSLNYWIDGIVIRVNDNVIYKDMGVVGKTPRALVAWKFPAEESVSIIEDIEWFVGRTGALTPVAKLQPTSLAGTTVTHASLHNIDEIERLDVRIGDTVVIYKAGDIIPKVKEALVHLRSKKANKLPIPTSCPICESNVIRREGEVALYCSNPNCFAKERERLIHAVRAFEIDGFGPQTADLLLNNKIVQYPPDLFGITVDDIIGLERFAEKSAKKLVDEIQSKKTIPLDRFLVALGIRHVGEETARLISSKFKTLNGFLSATQEALASVEGIGDVVAQSIIEYVNDDHHQQLIQDYLERGITIESSASALGDRLSGNSFVLTGTLPTLSRSDAESLIRQQGGFISSSVSKNTSYLLVGDNPGSKFSKAQNLGIPTLTEEDFLRMIGSK